MKRNVDQILQDLEKKEYHITDPTTGAVWSIPTRVIAKHYARSRADETGESLEKAAIATVTYFNEDEYEISEWTGNMNWSEVSEHATMIQQPRKPDMETVWMNHFFKIV